MAGRPRKVVENAKADNLENLENEIEGETPESDKVAQLEQKVDTLTDLFAQFMKHEMSKSVEPVQSTPLNNTPKKQSKPSDFIDSDEEDELNNIIIDPVTFAPRAVRPSKKAA